MTVVFVVDGTPISAVTVTVTYVAFVFRAGAGTGVVVIGPTGTSAVAAGTAAIVGARFQNVALALAIGALAVVVLAGRAVTVAAA